MLVSLRLCGCVCVWEGREGVSITDTWVWLELWPCNFEMAQSQYFSAWWSEQSLKAQWWSCDMLLFHWSVTSSSLHSVRPHLLFLEPEVDIFWREGGAELVLKYQLTLEMACLERWKEMKWNLYFEHNFFLQTINKQTKKRIVHNNTVHSNYSTCSKRSGKKCKLI